MRFSGIIAGARRRYGQQGFTLVELLVTMAITTVILGATMAAMNDAIKATESARQITDMNNGLRTAMDLMVRDMLQVGQGLPGGRAILVPNGGAAVPMQLPGPEGSNYSARWPIVLSATGDRPRYHLRRNHGGDSRSQPWSRHRRRSAGDRHDYDAGGRQLVRIGHPAGVCGNGRSITVPLPGVRPPAVPVHSTRHGIQAATTFPMTLMSPATTFVLAT